MANPAAAAPLIASLKSDAEREAITALIKDNSRLALDLQPAGKIRKADRGDLQSRHRCRPVQGHAARLVDL